MSFQDTEFVRTMHRIFPTPALLTLPVAGVDISDISVKWIVLAQSRGRVFVESYGELAIPEGVIGGGIIKNTSALSGILKEMKHTMRVEYVHVSLPEESVYVFCMQVPRSSTREQLKTMIEFEFENRVPLSLADAVYDFDIVNEDGVGDMNVVVTAVPHDLAMRYAQVFDQAGLRVLSFENELLSTTSALASQKDKNTGTLVIDFGASRTGIACVRGNIPILTATIPVSTRSMTDALSGSLGISDAEAIAYLDAKGLSDTGSAAFRAIGPIADMLANQVDRYFRLWGFGKDSTESFIVRGIMVGGGANIRGLPERIAQSIRIPIECGNVWCRFVSSFDDYIPPIEYDVSLRYATAIGLALRNISL